MLSPRSLDDLTICRLRFSPEHPVAVLSEALWSWWRCKAVDDDYTKLREQTLAQIASDEYRQRLLGRRHHYIAELMYWGAVLSSAVATVCAAMEVPVWLMASMAILPATFTAGGRNAHHRERSNWHYLYVNELTEIRHRIEETRSTDQLLEIRAHWDRVASAREHQFPRPKDVVAVRNTNSK